MAYRLRITELALADLDAILAAGAGAGWLEGLARAVGALVVAPSEHPLAPESASTGFEARELRYRAHRVVFAVEEDAIVALRVYQGPGQSLTLNLLPSAA